MKVNIHSNILIIEPDRNLAIKIKTLLEELDLVPQVELSSKQALELIMSKKYKLIILEMSLAGISGLEIVEKVRSENLTCPIIMLSDDCSYELEAYAYKKGISILHKKPIGEELFKSQIMSMMITNKINSIIKFGNFELNNTHRICFKNEKELLLTESEFELLYHLLCRPNQIFTREELLLITKRNKGKAGVSCIDTTISRLRKKLGESVVETVFRQGYRINSK